MRKKTGRKVSSKSGRKKRPAPGTVNRTKKKADRPGFLLFGILVLGVLALAGSAVWNRVTTVGEEPVPPPEEKEEIKTQVLLEIRNGWGERGWADKFRNPFILVGYDVVDITNAEDFEFEVSIVAVLKPQASAEGGALADLLETKMVLQYEHDSYADLAFILGKDAREVLQTLTTAGGDR